MQYNIRWLTHDDIPLIKSLSAEIYKNSGNTYGPNLGPNSRLYDLFLVPSNIFGSEYRKVVGVFDDNNNLVLAVGARQLQATPAWLLSWMLSSVKTARFAVLFKKALLFLCDYYESIGHNEFYVVHPTEKENVYRNIIKFMRERYWTFVELTIPTHEKCQYGFYWSLMGFQLYPYDVMIRRYILKREP